MAEALQLGQLLQKGNFISHVCDDHEFKNENLFFLYVDAQVISLFYSVVAVVEESVSILPP